MYGYWVRQRETIIARIFAYYHFQCIKKSEPPARFCVEGPDFGCAEIKSKGTKYRARVRWPKPRTPCGDGRRCDRRAPSEGRDSTKRRRATTCRRRRAP